MRLHTLTEIPDQITVTLVSNTRLSGADGSRVTIKNLVGTTTLDQAGFVITDLECNPVIQQCPTKVASPP